MFDEKITTYYCLSDKDTKCEQYTQYDLIYINSTIEIKEFPNIVIIDSSIPQVYNHNYPHDYTHIICTEGSSVILYPYKEYNFYYYAILHKNSVEMKNALFEGKGSLSLIVQNQFYIHSTAKKNNIDFSLRTIDPFSAVDTYILALKPDSTYNLENKIKVKEPLVFHGPESLSGLFESDKFIVGNYGQIVEASDILEEYPYDGIRYCFNEGTYEIPFNWKKSCQLYGKRQNETTLIFNDVYKYDGRYVNSIFQTDSAYLIIKPAKYFGLITFPSELKINFTLKIEN